jgi:hypothetical protein
LIKRLLLENISLRGIGRAAGVGLRWLLQLPFNCTLRQRVSRLARATSHSLKSSAITLAPLNISFVMTISPNVQHYQDCTTEVSTYRSKTPPARSITRTPTSRLYVVSG